MSLWERHKNRIYKYGHIYATLFGLVAVNYIPLRPTNSYVYCLSVLYSHLVAVLLILVIPVYFGSNITSLMQTTESCWNLLLVVHCANTVIKYVTVTITYFANLAYNTALRDITRQRQQLEDCEFCRNPLACIQPQRKFESMLLFKFGLINLMMVLQSVEVCYLWWTGANMVRVYFALYTFVLWNYTENMADYFYFINSSALKFFRELHEQLWILVQKVELFSSSDQKRGMLMQHCCTLSDELDGLARKYAKSHKLYFGSVHLQQFQILGLLLTTLITNLSNSFTLFNLFRKSSNDTTAMPFIILNTLHALAYYTDTYIVSLISESINNELRDIGYTMRQLSQVAAMDVRLEQSIEQFSLQLMNSKVGFRICGLFDLNRSLAFLTAATELSYFVTLVQFDMNLSSLK